MTATEACSVPGRLAFVRLLQLASPALPIGAFAYSQGLEPAVNAGLVRDEGSARSWILGLLASPIARWDLPVCARMYRGFDSGDVAAAWRWNAVLLSSRATAELQAEDRHLGSSLARVLVALGVSPPSAGTNAADDLGGASTFAGMFAFATAHWKIDVRLALEAFAFTWAEAQVSAAVRLVPLGQSAGARILADVGRAIPDVVDGSLGLADDHLGATAPLLALLSVAHETQYSRLFRS